MSIFAGISVLVKWPVLRLGDSRVMGSFSDFYTLFRPVDVRKQSSFIRFASTNNSIYYFFLHHRPQLNPRLRRSLHRDLRWRLAPSKLQVKDWRKNSIEWECRHILSVASTRMWKRKQKCVKSTSSFPHTTCCLILPSEHVLPFSVVWGNSWRVGM